jgi:hypothetical protein
VPRSLPSRFSIGSTRRTSSSLIRGGEDSHNTPVQQDATSCIDWLTDGDFDAHVFYQVTPTASHILIQDADLAETYQVWELQED